MNVEESRGNEVDDIGIHELVENRHTRMLHVAVRTVLHSSVCKQYFLSKDTESQSTKIVTIVTDIVKEVVQMSNDNDIKLKDCVDFYHEAILSTLQTSNSNLSRNLQVLPVFVSALTVTQCKEILELVLNCDVDEEDDDDLLISVLEKILPVLSQSHVKFIKLTENGVDRLLNCFVNVQKSSDLLLNFFKKFPMLTAQCSENTVMKLFTMDNHSGLVIYLLENNARLKVKVGEIIQTSDLDWTKSDNIKVLIKYIQLETRKSGEISFFFFFFTKKLKKKNKGILFWQWPSVCCMLLLDNY